VVEGCEGRKGKEVLPGGRLSGVVVSLMVNP